MTVELLTSEAEARSWIGAAFAPTEQQWAQLDRFAAMLVEENAQQNLIAASTIPTLWVRHIADSAQLLMPIQRITDLAVTGTRHSWQGNTVTVEIDISNLGPSQNLSFTADFALPVGMQITNAECRRGNLPCNDGFTAGGGHLISLTDGNGLLPNRTPYTAILTATWNGVGAPGDMTIRTFTDATAIDTDDGATTTYTISGPSAGDIIFSNGFE